MTYFCLALVVGITWKGYGYHGGVEFKGIPIHVREPIKNFNKMKCYIILQAIKK